MINIPERMQNWTERPRSEAKIVARTVLVLLLVIFMVLGLVFGIVESATRYPWPTLLVLCLAVVGPFLKWVMTDD